ncbi:hypothetical protein [Demequina aestuarii]|uniref:hypothetical protein n=1 Tax=Demequina aestuarii TaxID=327095 RepID=UPI00078168A0|nr:hypothetical protein [Demequina aestuarii]
MRRRREPTLHIDANFDLWLPVPSSWPWEHHADVDAWANAVAIAFGDAYGWDDATRQWCRESVRTLSTEAPEDETRLAIIDPEGRWLFFASVLWAPTDESVTVAQLAAADDENAVRAIETTDVVTDGLGAGVRTVRYVDDQTGSRAIVGIIQHAFRTDGLDIMVIASSHDVILLQELEPEIDALAQSLSVS